MVSDIFYITIANYYHRSETPGVQKSLPGFAEKMKGNLRTMEQGADTQIYLAVSPDVEGITGKFFEDRNPVSTHFWLAFTEESQEERTELMKKCNELLRSILNTP